MENKKKKLFLSLCLLLCIFLTVLTIKDTYAKYITSTSGDANINIARWKILINNEDVVKQTEISKILTPVFPGNSNIAKNVLAPTSEGYVDLLIDAEDTDVSLNTEITTEKSTDSAVEDFIISGYSIDDGDRVDLDTENGELSINKNILYEDTTKSFKIRIYLKWNDDTDTQTMDNEADTNATQSEDAVGKVKIKLKFIQIAN